MLLASIAVWLHTTTKLDKPTAKFAALASTLTATIFKLDKPRIPMSAAAVGAAGTATKQTVFPTPCVKIAPPVNTTMNYSLPSAKHATLEDTVRTTAKWAKFPNPWPVPFVGLAGTTTDPTNRRKRLAKPAHMDSI